MRNSNIHLRVVVEDNTTGGPVGSGELGPFKSDVEAAHAASIYVSADIDTFMDLVSEAE